MRFVNRQKFRICRYRFLRRRKGVARTLDYVNAERSLLKSTGRCEDRTVQGGRKRLLDEIRSWYGEELNKIDMTLDRLHDSSTLGERQLK